MKAAVRISFAIESYERGVFCLSIEYGHDGYRLPIGPCNPPS